LKTEKAIQAEVELVERLKAGDEKALELAYDRYSAAVYGVLLKILNHEEAAEDILQESFVKIWTNIGRYDDSKGAFFTWIINIARNSAIDLLRSKNFKAAAKAQNLELSARSINTHNSTQQLTDTIGLREKVQKLSPEHQQMIDFQYFKGYTQSEVADELMMPLGTVKTRTRAALNELRKMLN
jgi:RNA polymerase sigma-70 factor (ECF subfamily)